MPWDPQPHGIPRPLTHAPLSILKERTVLKPRSGVL